MRTILIALFIPLLVPAYGQRLTPEGEISILTCGPGKELYSVFGHSAMRVKDSKLGVDLVFNYGGFDFQTPFFYLKFAQSKLPYHLFIQDFEPFVQEYRRDNRWVKEQVLSLDSAAKQQVFNFLRHNALPENAAYKYDFFFDNCATKLPEVIQRVLGDSVTFNDDHITTRQSHRELLKPYLREQAWGRLGIDLALGALIDDPATSAEYLFLPDHVLAGFDNAWIHKAGRKEKIVQRSEIILPASADEKRVKLPKPLPVFTALCLLVLVLTFRDFKRRTRNRWIDFLMFFVTGLTGALILFLWFGTDHHMATKNFSLLWAFAPNLLLSPFMFKGHLPAWMKRYLLLLLSLLLTAIICWIAGVQTFNEAVVPIWTLLLVRYVYVIWSIEQPATLGSVSASAQ